MLFIDVDAAFANDVARRMDALLGWRGLDGRHGLSRTEGPAGAYERTEQGWRWVADIPGAKREDVHVTAENGVLLVEVKRVPPELEAGFQPRHLERRPFELRRSMRLPDDVDTENIRAVFEHGVLTVSIPRSVGPTRAITVTRS
jgi:HSP20 family molecular chaperone IbpA